MVAAAASTAPRAVPRLPRSVTLVLLLLAGALVAEGGPLSGAVAGAVAIAATGAALALCTLVASRSVPVVARTRVRTAMRDRARRTAFLPQRDPDASGRPRPRAPGRRLPTAA